MSWTKDNGKFAKDAAEQALLQANYLDEKKPLIDKFTDEQTNLQAQINQLVAEGDSSPEAAQARVGVDDTVYDTLKNRLDDEYTQVTQQLTNITLNINSFKTDSNTWNDAFDLAYSALPQYGGKILIPQTIRITRSINLHDLGTKKVMIVGNSKMNNPDHIYNSIIIKEGDFDAVILGHGCGMRDVSVSRDKDYADTHDGIWVAGITCSLENVYVNDQGGDGIRVGSKLSDPLGKLNTNIGRFINIGSYNNKGWGIVVKDDFATGINTSNANACMFIAPDCRENWKGGILFEDCMDNQVYSADCEVNYGEAGIKIGDDAGGISIYSAYTENESTYEILLTEGSSQNIIFGYRRGGQDDGVTDLGVGNFVLGKYGTKFSGSYFHNKLSMKGLNIGRKDKAGYMSIDHSDDGGFEIVTRGGASKWLSIKSDSGQNDVTLISKDIIIGAKDRLNYVRVRPSSNVTETIVPAGSSVTKTISATGIKVDNFIIASPHAVLPSGITYYAITDTEDQVKLTLTNVTAASVTVPAQNWRFLGVSATALA